MKLATSFVLFAISAASQAADFQRDAIALRPAHTFSIVARDFEYVNRSRFGFFSVEG